MDQLKLNIFLLCLFCTSNHSKIVEKQKIQNICEKKNSFIIIIQRDLNFIESNRKNSYLCNILRISVHLLLFLCDLCVKEIYILSKMMP